MQAPVLTFGPDLDGRLPTVYDELIESAMVHGQVIDNAGQAGSVSAEVAYKHNIHPWLVCLRLWHGIYISTLTLSYRYKMHACTRTQTYKLLQGRRHRPVLVLQLLLELLLFRKHLLAQESFS